MLVELHTPSGLEMYWDPLGGSGGRGWSEGLLGCMLSL